MSVRRAPHRSARMNRVNGSGTWNPRPLQAGNPFVRRLSYHEIAGAVAILPWRWEVNFRVRRRRP
jgi:hypothetical protein